MEKEQYGRRLNDVGGEKTGGKKHHTLQKKAKAVSTPQGEKGASNAHFERRRLKKKRSRFFGAVWIRKGGSPLPLLASAILRPFVTFFEGARGTLLLLPHLAF